MFLVPRIVRTRSVGVRCGAAVIPRCVRLPTAIWLAIAISLCQAAAGSAQEASDNLVAFQRVGGYSLVEIQEDQRPVDLELVQQSMLSWSNPVFGTTAGGLFLWVNDGRPAVVMKTYKTKNDRWFEQIRSLSTNRIIARESQDGAIFWSPDQGAEPMKRLPRSPRPAASEVSRLVQMKSLHRKFVAKGDIEGAGGQQELRVYPRPLYRYKTDAVIDGAVLGFTQGTGPDVLLILEARQSEGEASWYYRLGSIGIFKVDVFYDGEPVWSEPRRTAANTKPTDLYDGRRLPL